MTAYSAMKISSVVALSSVLVGAVGCDLLRGRDPEFTSKPPMPSDGPTATAVSQSLKRGNAALGKNVFRFETFGNEGFWTDAMQMPAGILEKDVTPIKALEVGLLVDAESIPADLKKKLLAELQTDMSPSSAPMLNDVRTTVKLIEANAVVGIVAVDTNGDRRLDIASGDKVGVSCAICHTITDKSVFEIPGKGSIGKVIDGPAALVLNVGKLLATAKNSRAYYPNLQLVLGGATFGRATKGITADSSEDDVDAYLSDPKLYPIGTFDETQDGAGNSVNNTPLFEQDLAGPYGSAGEHAFLENIGNGSYTTNLDPTTLLTPEGREFMKLKAGALGVELTESYEKVLKETGVKGYPFVKAARRGKVGDPSTPVGLRVDEQKLLDMNAYLADLPAPAGAPVERAVFVRGREVFRENCTSCHNVDQSKAVPATIIDMATMMPGYDPLILQRRIPPQSPVQNSSGLFDDKMIVVDASDRGEKRGFALPLLLDLARKERFLHDASVEGLEPLLNPKRGNDKPHPFYIDSSEDRMAIVAFLQGLDTGSMSEARAVR